MKLLAVLSVVLVFQTVAFGQEEVKLNSDLGYIPAEKNDPIFANIAFSKDENYLLSYATPITWYPDENHELRLFSLKDGNFLGTPYSSYVGSYEGTRITDIVSSPDRSKIFFLTFSHYYHSLTRQGYWSFDSTFMTMLDFSDTLHELFKTKNFYAQARFEFTKDSKQLIIYDKDTALFLDAVTGSPDYKMPFKTNEYSDTRDTVYSPDSSVKAQYVNVWNGGGRLAISKRNFATYDTIFTRDSFAVTEPIFFSPDSKYVIYNFGESYYVNRIDSSSLHFLFGLTRYLNRAILQFSPDSKFLLCNFYDPNYSTPIAGFEDTVGVWDLQTGNLKTTLFAGTGQKLDFFYFLNDALYSGSVKLYKWLFPFVEIIPISSFTQLSLKNFPDPFYSQTTITLSSSSQQFVNISVVNLLGADCGRLFTGTLDVGEHSFQWNAQQFPAGVYFCIVHTAEGMEKIPMMKE